MKRLSVGWQDDQATVVFEDQDRELTLRELDPLFQGSRYRVTHLERVQAPAPSAEPAAHREP